MPSPAAKFAFTFLPSLRPVLVLLIASVIASAIGCGDEKTTPTVPPPSDDPPSAVDLTPPDPMPTDPMPTDPTPDAPGEMQMPADDAASSGSGESADESDADASGFRMPDQSSTPSRPPIASWAQIRELATGGNRVTVLDVWSLACPPCLAEFPELVSLHRRWGDRVACIAANIDFDGRRSRPPESYRKRVVEFMDEVGADFPVLICSTPNEEIYQSAEFASIPAVLVFDSAGKLVAQFHEGGEVDYRRDVEPTVQRLLAVTPPSGQWQHSTIDHDR